MERVFQMWVYSLWDRLHLQRTWHWLLRREIQAGKNHRDLERFFWQPCSYLLSAQASYTSGNLARVEEESQDSQGCPAWTGSQGSPISFFLSPHAADADIQKEMSRRSWHTAALPARGLPISFPKNFLTAAMEWGKYTRNVIFLLNCIKLMTFPFPFALL